MKKYLYLFIFLIISLQGCKDDFLDKTDYGALSPEIFPQEIAQVELFVNSLYANQHSFGLYGHDIFAKGFYPLEHASDQEWVNDEWWNNVHQNNVAPGKMGEVANMWRDCSRGVTQANTLLGVVNNYKTKYAKSGEEAQLTTIEGQAYYFRAWYRLLLFSFFSESFITNGQGGDLLGIPLINTVPEKQSDMFVKRATVQQSLDSIIVDFKRAEVMMNGKTSWEDAYKTKITVWSVKSMLGKAYLYAEKFAEAKATLKDVIDNSGKSLVTFDVYKNMFVGMYKNNSESITEISYKQDGGWSTWGVSTANNAPMVFEPAVYAPDTIGNRTFASWTNIFVHDKNLSRFGFNEPTAAPTSNPAWNNLKPNYTNVNNLREKPSDVFLARSKAAKTDGSVDPRLWVASFQPFVDEYNAFGKMAAIAPVIQYDNEIGSYHSFSFRKYTNLDGRGPDKGMNYMSQMYIMRLADVYLMYAEACAKTSDAATALEYINKVHRRAYNQPVDAVSTFDYATLTSATKASDVNLKNDPLKYERWAELFGEGGWWFDVRRWKIGQAEADYYVKVRSGTIKWDENRSYALPIPVKEFETNPSMQQNKGY